MYFVRFTSFDLLGLIFPHVPLSLLRFVHLMHRPTPSPLSIRGTFRQRVPLALWRAAHNPPARRADAAPRGQRVGSLQQPLSSSAEDDDTKDGGSSGSEA